MTKKQMNYFHRVAMGEGIGEIRLPNTAGIAGVYLPLEKL